MSIQLHPSPALSGRRLGARSVSAMGGAQQKQIHCAMSDGVLNAGRLPRVDLVSWLGSWGSRRSLAAPTGEHQAGGCCASRSPKTAVSVWAIAAAASALALGLVGQPGAETPAALFLLAIWMQFRVTCAWHIAAQSASHRRLQADADRALAQARLALIQDQGSPQLLLGHLSTLEGLMFSKDPRAAAFLSQLVLFLDLSRFSLRKERATLGHEIDLVESYLTLASMKPGKRVFVHVSCPVELRDMPFPNLAIHALAENALIHGTKGQVGPVYIQVHVNKVGGSVLVDVTDDGVGLSSQSGVLAPPARGLSNVKKRLARDYQDRARLTVVDQPSRGVLARIEITGTPL